MMEQRAPKIQSDVVYQRKKKTIEGTKDMMEQRAPKIQSEVVYQRKKKTIHDGYQRKKKTRHDGIEGTKDLVRSRISKKEKDNT